MPSLDTSVLVRWLLDDEPAQAKSVSELFEASRANQTRLFVPYTVTLELEWVLRSRYQLDKAAVLSALNGLLETQEIDFQAEAALEQAIHRYRLGSAEFADCLHAGVSSAADRAPLLTFDAKAARLADVQLLEI
jgi:predicted nucleic-acid-binding protein